MGDTTSPVVGAGSGGLVHELFERAAASRPDTPAVVDGPTTLTYGELEARANRVARHLRSLGVVPDDRVAVLLERSAATVVALLGILKAGGAYVGLDPAYPDRRLQLMVDESAPRVVLTDAVRAGRVDAAGASLVRLDEAVAAQPDASKPPESALPQHLAYVVFTSGSTGTPKGAALAHAGLRDLLDWYVGTFAPGLRCLHYNSFSFDASFTDLFAALSSGGTVVLVPEGVRRDLPALLRLVEAEGAQRLNLPTPVFHQLAASMPGRLGTVLGGVRELWISGDRLRLSREAAAVLAGAAPIDVRNQYGPSETHVCTDHRIDVFHDPDAAAAGAEMPSAPPIGRAVGTSRVYVLDADLRPVAAGAVGEIFVGGRGVARGYLGRPALTAERFLPDPFRGEGTRMYRTGDLARVGADGSLEFCGRADDQLKVRGFRVEPGEVEACLASCPGVRQAAVVGRDPTGSGDHGLAAYVVLDLTRADLALVRRHVADRLPEHMVPSWFVVLDALPLNENGKVDRVALPAPAGARAPASPREGAHAETVVLSGAEELVAAIWRDVLGVEELRSGDRFADLGGHSLTVIEVAERIRMACGAELRVPEVMNAGSLGELAALVASRADDGTHVSARAAR